MPRLLDKGMERFMIPMMKTDRPPRDRDDNNLYSSSTDLMERAGAGSNPPREFSVYTSAVTHPRTTGAVMVGAGLALAALLQMRRQRTQQ
jgi:hypothetical protein